MMMNRQEEHGVGGGHGQHGQQSAPSEMAMAAPSAIPQFAAAPVGQFQPSSTSSGSYPSSAPAFSPSPVPAGGPQPSIFGAPPGQSMEHHPHGLMGNPSSHHAPPSSAYGGAAAAPGSNINAVSQPHLGSHQPLYAGVRPVHHHPHHGMVMSNHSMMGPPVSHAVI